MRRSIAVLFSLAVLECILSVGASAQGIYSCQQYAQLIRNDSCLFHWGYDVPVPAPVGTVCCNPGGIPFGQKCVAPSNRCGAPPGAANDICPSCVAAGAPINLSTGNTYIIESDISIPGLGGGLNLSRTWNSMLPPNQNSFTGMFGINWRSTYEERLIFNSCDSYLKYARGNGSVWSFGVVNTGSVTTYQTVAPGNDTTTITETLVGNSVSWSLAFKSGEKRTFDSTSGSLLSIIDRNGNTTQLTYDGSNRLITVTDAASRHLNFTYPNGSSTLVSSVASDVGVSLSYSYDGQGRLVQVTKPDNTTVLFVYDAQNMITAVKDSDGKILESHTYDVLGRGLTSSRANGVDSVTVSYPQ